MRADLLTTTARTLLRLFIAVAVHVCLLVAVHALHQVVHVVHVFTQVERHHAPHLVEVLLVEALALPVVRLLLHCARGAHLVVHYYAEHVGGRCDLCFLFGWVIHLHHEFGLLLLRLFLWMVLRLYIFWRLRSWHTWRFRLILEALDALHNNAEVC